MQKLSYTPLAITNSWAIYTRFEESPKNKYKFYYD